MSSATFLFKNNYPICFYAPNIDTLEVAAFYFWKAQACYPTLNTFCAEAFFRANTSLSFIQDHNSSPDIEFQSLRFTLEDEILNISGLSYCHCGQAAYWKLLYRGSIEKFIKDYLPEKEKTTKPLVNSRLSFISCFFFINFEPRLSSFKEHSMSFFPNFNGFNPQTNSSNLAYLNPRKARMDETY